MADDCLTEHDRALFVINCGLKGHRFAREQRNTCRRCGFVDDSTVAPFSRKHIRRRWTLQMDAHLLRCRAERLPFTIAADEVAVSPSAAHRRMQELSCRPEVVGMRLLHEMAADRPPSPAPLDWRTSRDMILAAQKADQAA